MAKAAGNSYSPDLTPQRLLSTLPVGGLVESLLILPGQATGDNVVFWPFVESLPCHPRLSVRRQRRGGKIQKKTRRFTFERD